MASLLTEGEWLAAARRCLGAAEGEGVPLSLEAPPAPVRSASATEAEDVEGFVAETLALRVLVRVGDEGTKELRMFLKAVPRANAARARLCVTSHCFEKEGGLYTEAFPQLQAALPLPLPLPRCLLALHDLLLLEDLAPKGFRPLPNMQVDEAHCRAALGALAVLHAASLALEAAQPPQPLGQRFPHCVQENMFSDAYPSYMNRWFAAGIPGMKHLVGLIPKYRDSDVRAAIQKKIDECPSKIYEMAKASFKFRNVICHGDLWAGNILFRYSSAGSVADVRLVDFQQARYCPPATDIVAFFFLSTRRTFRAQHFTPLLQHYHAALVRAWPGAADALPLSELQASCDELASFGRIMAACYLPCNLLSQEVLREVVGSEASYERYLTADRSALFEREWARNAAYRSAVTEALEELVEGVLLRPSAPVVME